MEKKNSTITISSTHRMYQDKMAMISAFSNLVLLLVTAEVTSALNSPVPVVHTVSNVTLISGKKATLTCKYNRAVYAVYWRYEGTTSPMKKLVVLEKYFKEVKRSGPGYDEGRFNITDDYSLIIHDVQARDEGKYFCEVTDYETGSLYRNHTDVTTVVIAERPFIRIEQCVDEVTADKINEPCILHTSSEDRTVQLTCTVVGVKPLVDLTWEASLSEHWEQVMNQSTLTILERENEIFDQTLTVNIDTSHIKSNNQRFTCIGQGLAVDGIANYTIAVYPARVGSYGTRTVVTSVVCTLFFTFVIMGILWTWRKARVKRRSQKGEDPENQEEANTPLTQIDGDAVESKRESHATSAQTDGDALEGKGESDATPENKADEPDRRPLLERKRTKIRNYLPNKPTTTNKATTYINIGVFGKTNAGKSSFISSLIFALSGFYPKADEGATAADNPKYGGFKANKEWIKLTDHINIINFKGMKNFKLGQVARIFREIKGQGKGTKDIPKGQIYCLIFICDYSTYTEQCRNFMKRLSDEVRSHFGRGITVVVTKKNTIGCDDAMIMSEATGVTKEHTWIFENYTRDNNEEDVEKSIEFLDFISQCLEVVESNQKFRRDKLPFRILSKDTHHRNVESDLL